MKEPVDHIERPTLPWRENASLTECGISAIKVRTLTRTDFARRMKEWGERRTAITTCMTCMETTRRYADWNQDPRGAIAREISWEGAVYSAYLRSSDKHGHQLLDELRAIALLIKAHPEEFNALLHQIRNTVDFAAERRKKFGLKA